MEPQRAIELARVFDETNPADLTRQITAIRTRLIALAKDKTEAISASVSRAKIDEAPDQIFASI
jgi:hypothetical protein